MAHSFENKIKDLDEKISFLHELSLKHPKANHGHLFLYFTQKRAELANSIGRKKIEWT